MDIEIELGNGMTGSQPGIKMLQTSN